MLCWVKEARYRRPHILWSQLHELARKDKALLGRGHMTADGHQGSSGVDGNVLKLQCDDNWTTVSLLRHTELYT